MAEGTPVYFDVYFLAHPSPRHPQARPRETTLRMDSTSIFWLVALALVAGTLGLLVIPLLRRRAMASGPADEAAAAAVFRDHKRQVEADFTAGSIDAAGRDEALADLVTRFGNELAQVTPGENTTAPGHRRWIAALALVALVPIGAASIYYHLGSPTALDAPKAQAEHSISDAQMATAVDTLAKRLQANPDDGEGWAMLGRSYRTMGRFDAASLAFSEAVKHLPPSAAVLTDWAESVAQAQGRNLAGQPTELVNRALAIDPAYPKALAMAGGAAIERGDPATALTYWRRLRAALPADNPDLAQIDTLIAQVEVAARNQGSGTAAPTSAAATAPADKPTATAAATPASPAAANGAGAPGKSVAGKVEVDPRLAAKLVPSDVVFIFARNPDAGRMPLAAMKITVAELPKTFDLTDAMAMTPAATISGAAKIVIEARVSKSGDVVARPGDLSGVSATVAPGARDVRVVIDKVVP